MAGELEVAPTRTSVDGNKDERANSGGSAADALRRSLRGRSFEEQEAMLTPKGAAGSSRGVQMKAGYQAMVEEGQAASSEVGADEETRTGDGRALTNCDDWERVPPQAAERVDGPLDDKALQKTLKKLQGMSPRLDPTWIERCQEALGVPASGGFTRAFLQAVATFEREGMGRKKPVGLSDKAVRRKLGEAHPELGAIPQHFEAAQSKSSSKASKEAPDWMEQGVVSSGLAKSWSEFRGQFQKTELCGQTVHGHPLFIERIQVAEQYLEKKFQSKGSALGKAVGCSKVADLRDPQRPGYHPTGFALDIDVADNPWILGQDGRAEGNRRTKEVIERAVRFMGYGHALDLAKLQKMNQTMTTDELYDHLQASNVALRNYRLLAGNDEAIDRHWRSAPEEAKKDGDAAWWRERIAEDDKLLSYQGKAHRKDSNWDDGNATNKGFMTMRQELVVALRDIAGLSWGACDMGGDSGDMMHFDARTIDKAKKLIGAVKNAKATQS